MSGPKIQWLIAVLFASGVISGAASALARAAAPGPGGPVQAALDSLPGYGVFDYLAWRDAGAGKVRLLGQVTSASLKAAAEKAVEGLPGVTGVDDAIEILPASADDDSVRQSVYRAVYSGPAPARYAARKSIHIIVKRRNVTLEGTVESDIDRTMIAAAAAGSGNIFSFTNNLVALAPDSPDAQWRLNLAAGAKPGERP